MWLDRVAKRGIPVVNVEVFTPANLVLELARPTLVDRGIRYLDELGWRAVVGRVLWERMDSVRAGLLVDRLTPGLIAAVSRSIRELRQHGLTGEPAWESRFETPEKGAFLAALGREIDAILEKEQLADDQLAAGFALERWAERPLRVPEASLLWPRDVDAPGLLGNVLESWPQERVVRLDVDEPKKTESARVATVSGANARGRDRAAQNEPDTPNRRVEIHACRTEGQEVEEVLRLCAGRGVRLDQLELVYTDASLYIATIHDVMSRLLLQWNEEAPFGEDSGAGKIAGRDSLPVTFSEGLPCVLFTPGRALAAWAKWVKAGAPGDGLATLLGEGLVHAPDVRGKSVRSCDPSALHAAARLLRFAPRLEGAEARIEAERKARVAGQRATRRRPLVAEEVLAELERVVAHLRSIGVELGQAPRSVLEGARRFLSELAVARNERDLKARRVLLDRLEGALAWEPQAGESPWLDAWDWVSQLPNEAPVAGESPRAGCVHVSPLRHGGHTRRRLTAVLGMNEEFLPRGIRPDAIVSDPERLALGGGLKTSAERRREELAAFESLLARVKGDVILSYSLLEATDGRERRRSPVLLPIADSIETREHAGEGGSGCRPALDLRGYWPSRLPWPLPQEDIYDFLVDHSLNLAEGWAARVERYRDKFTEYDGWVPEAGADLDPTVPGGLTVSATELETLGTCPLRFFFQHGLHVRPPSWERARPGEWLDAGEAGSLLHEVFERYVRERLESGDTVFHREGLPRSLEILEDVARSYMGNNASVPPAAHARLLAELRRATRIFLIEEEWEHERSPGRPAFLEASLGMPSGASPSELDCEEAVRIDVEGLSIRARGKIDRVDAIRNAAGEAVRYRVLDYKSGSDSKYSASDPFQKGRKIQSYLYLELLAKRLREVLGQGVEVVSFGYFFPGTKAAGNRIAWMRDERFAERGRLILGRLLRILRTGAFNPTDKHTDCSYCDYHGVCFPVEIQVEAVKRKIANPANAELESFQTLRRS
jgi:RecB family exonuclease